MNKTETELQVYLTMQYRKEDESCDWKDWSDLKNCVGGRDGNDIASYASAFANMEGGTLILGMRDSDRSISGIDQIHQLTADSLPQQLINQCTNLPSVGLRVDEFICSDSRKRVWLVHIPKHAPRQPVYAHRQAWQRVGDSLVKLQEDKRQAILSEPLHSHDWTAALVPDACMADLDLEALAKARAQFAAKHVQERWASEISAWTDAVFLDRAKLSIHGQLTRACLLLLGNAQSAHWLSPQPAQISWKLPDERVIENFSPPFLLTTSVVLSRIRSPMIKLFPATQLLATEIPKYEARVVLEALHNCLAHQDYECSERIVIEETIDRLVFKNAGGFIDGALSDDYATGHRTPARYRNKWLADAMNRLGMIDTGGFGIKDMFNAQRKRYLPLPDYSGSDSSQVTLTIFGQTIDERYSRLLMEKSDLPIEQVIWLDRVQKKQALDDAQITQLKAGKLVEGRKPNWYVAASIADATNTRAAYTKNRGLDDAYFKKLILTHLTKFGSASSQELRELVIDKLPAALSDAQKKNKVTNLLSALRMHGLDSRKIVADRPGLGAKWRIKEV